jgi:hypothetical protein
MVYATLYLFIVPNTDSDTKWRILKILPLNKYCHDYESISIYSYHLIVHWVEYSDPKNKFKISDCGTLEEASMAHFNILIQQYSWRDREGSVG